MEIWIREVLMEVERHGHILEVEIKDLFEGLYMGKSMGSSER